MSTEHKRPVPAAVYLVADNLDAVLAAGEDLLALGDTTPADDSRSSVLTMAAAGRRFADRVRTLEMTVAARTLQARARAAEVRAADGRYRALIELFIAGTVPLQEAVADLGDSTAADFHTGGDAISYLRSRNVIAADAPGLRLTGGLAISETFLVAERIQLGALMDLCATFLDRLEDHYELYDDGDEDAAVEGAAAVVPAAVANDPPEQPTVN
jgi:hypothetical protein